MASTFKRSGLHRLECQDCDGYGYFTVAYLEKAAPVMPACHCGALFVPERLELAILLGVDDGTQRDAVELLALDKQRSQERSLGRRKLEVKRGNGTLNDMALKALEELREAEAEKARGRRLAAIGLGERVEKIRGEIVRTRFVLPTVEVLPF